jgi:hypothetical protein
VPVVRSVTEYTRSDGKRKKLRLFKAWRNLKDRVAGTNYAGSGATPWKGLEIGFRDWAHFRSWSLENGYSRERNSLDRKDPDKGYTPENCRWVTVAENTSYQYEMRILREGY